MISDSLIQAIPDVVAFISRHGVITHHLGGRKMPFLGASGSLAGRRLGQGDKQDAREGGIAQSFHQAHDGFGLRATGLALQFAVVGLARVQQQERVAGRCGVEDDKAARPVCNFAGEGTKHRDLLRARRAQIFLQQRASGRIHPSALRLHDFGLIGRRLRRGINFAECQPVHLPGQRLRNMRGWIGRAQMHRMTPPREHHRDGGGHGGLAHASLAHRHDHSAALALDVRDH